MKPLDTYKRLCTEFYDLDKPEAPTKALDYYLRHLKAEAGPVLEPMSGSGRFLAPLLERGIDVDGVDASPHMLQACRDRCARKGLIPVLYQQFLQELSLPRRYGFMFIPAGSFGLILDSHEAADSLKRLYDYLLPGGKLLLEIQTPQLQSQAQGTWTGRWHDRPDGAKLVISLLSKYDPHQQVQRTLCRYELFKDKRLVDTELEEIAVRYYTRDDFRLLLEAAGFADVKAGRSYEDGEPGDKDAALVFQARKP